MPRKSLATILYDAMITFAKGAKPEKFVGTRYYATTKVFTSWWSAAMARRFGERISIFTVSPGSNLRTNAGRHTTGFKRFLFTKLMPTIGPAIGMSQHVSVGAKRYVDVLHGVGGDYVNGKTYTSKPKKLTGPLQEMTHPHLLDVDRQEVAWSVLSHLTGTDQHQAQQSAAAE